MKATLIKKCYLFGEAILSSYSQIFFTENKILAVILIISSFINWWVGLSGLVAVITALVLSEILGYSKITIRKGLFSFNSLLVGLGIGTYFSTGLDVLVLIIIGGAIAFFWTVFIMGLLSKYGLPFLSIPFLLAMWLMILAFPAFTGITINTEALYPSNMFFKLGGSTLVSIVETLTLFFQDTGFDTYFLSLGAIFFQFNLLAGVLIAIGLLIHSRINFLFSLIGFFVAYWFYSFLGLYSGSLNYTYYGFNFILSAIALGGYFLIPSRQSLLWSLLLIPVLVLTTIGSDRLFAVFELSVFSLPFNVVIIGALYAFKIRFDQTRPPILATIQQNNPEKNAYLFDSQPVKKYAAYVSPIRLPFMGLWSVNQGHEGEFTHKDFFSFAWDFIIKEPSTQKEFSGEGHIVSDYYCFDKPVISPAPGTVVAIENNIEDNEIGVTNALQNWGNTVVIKHEDYLYTQLSHLKKGTVEVKIGESVIESQSIAKCGNSGRSPYPHLHFQLQASPKIGASTIFWPFSEYIVGDKMNFDFVPKGIPKNQESISNIPTSSILQSAFKWNPGDEFHLFMNTNNGKESTFQIRNEIDIYNQSYLLCVKTGAKLYYENNGKTFSALNYIGSKKSALFYFYRSLYKVVLSAEFALNMETRFPVHHLYKIPLITIQDFIVPFGIFLKGKFRLSYKENEQVFNPQKIDLEAQIIRRKNIFYSAEIEIGKNREIIIKGLEDNKSRFELKWVNSLY